MSEVREYTFSSKFFDYNDGKFKIPHTLIIGEKSPLNVYSTVTYKMSVNAYDHLDLFFRKGIRPSGRYVSEYEMFGIWVDAPLVKHLPSLCNASDDVFPIMKHLGQENAVRFFNYGGSYPLCWVVRYGTPAMFEWIAEKFQPKADIDYLHMSVIAKQLDMFTYLYNVRKVMFSQHCFQEIMKNDLIEFYKSLHYVDEKNMCRIDMQYAVQYNACKIFHFLHKKKKYRIRYTFDCKTADKPNKIDVSILSKIYRRDCSHELAIIEMGIWHDDIDIFILGMKINQKYKLPIPNVLQLIIAKNAVNVAKHYLQHFAHLQYYNRIIIDECSDVMYAILCDYMVEEWIKIPDSSMDEMAEKSEWVKWIKHAERFRAYGKKSLQIAIACFNYEVVAIILRNSSDLQKADLLDHAEQLEHMAATIRHSLLD